MPGLSSMQVVQLSAVDYGAWRRGQGEIPGAAPEIVRVVRQIPHWEVVSTFDLHRVHLVSRLAPSNTERSSIQAMYDWLSRVGPHPATFCETVAIMRHLVSQEKGTPNLICLGTLWLVTGELHYAGWQSGELKLYLPGFDLGDNFLCPVVLHSLRLQHPLPEAITAGARVDLFA